MNISSEQVGFDDALGDAERLHLQVSRRLLQAQKELHDAIFALDGTPAGLDRYASARAELDSAEAWALYVARLYVAKKMRRPAQRGPGVAAAS